MKHVLSLIFGVLVIATIFLMGCETHVHEVVHEGTVVSEQMIVE